jgi:uncharacterized protein (TIGR03000 family)
MPKSPDKGKKQAQAAPARVTVRLPADATLTIDNVVCPLTSTTRVFESPKLEPGRQFVYTVKAEVVRDGRPVSESRRVIVEAGKKLEVNFKDLAAVQAASR